MSVSSGLMAHDTKKWVTPATSAEVTEALIQVRVAMVQLYGMISSYRAGNLPMLQQAEKSFIDADQQLFRLINRIGGLDGPK